MSDRPEAPKSGVSIDQTTAIKNATESLYHKNDPEALLSLLAACPTEKDKKALLEKIQNVFRQKYDKELWIEHDQKTNKDAVRVKNWTAQVADREALSSAAVKIVSAVLTNKTGKVELPEWLQKYSEKNHGGKLDWIKDYAKDVLNQEIVFSREGDKIVASKVGNFKIPGPALPPVPTELKQDSQLTKSELAERRSKESRDKALSQVLEITKEAGDIITEAAKETKSLVSSAVDVVLSPLETATKVGKYAYNAVTEPIKEAYKTYVKPTVDAVVSAFNSNVVEPTKELYATYVQPGVDAVKSAYNAVVEPVKEVYNAYVQPIFDGAVKAVEYAGNFLGFGGQEKSDTTVASNTSNKTTAGEFSEEVGEDGEYVIRSEFTLDTRSQTPKIAQSKPLVFPKIPVESEFEPVQNNTVQRTSYSASTTLPTLAPSVLEDFLAPKYVPFVPSTEIAPQLEKVTIDRSSLRSSIPIESLPLAGLELPLTSRSSYFEMMLEDIESKLKLAELALAKQQAYEEYEEEYGYEEDFVPNAILAVVEAMQQSPELFANAEASKQREEHVEQVTRQVTAMIAPSVTPTASSIQAAEIAIVALAEAHASDFEIERIRGLIRSAKNRLEEKDLENLSAKGAINA